MNAALVILQKIMLNERDEKRREQMLIDEQEKQLINERI